MGSSIRWMWRWIKKLAKTLIIVFLTISFVGYSVLLLVDKQQLNGSNTSITNNITILLWHWPYGIRYSLAGNVCLRDYGISGCVLVDNRSLNESADLIVFHNCELKLRREHLPVNLHRPAKQRWVWLSLEAPQNNGILSQYKNLFNLTMSYHPHADITVPYGKLLQRKKPGLDFVIPTNKSYEACWVVSNYQKSHRRSAVFQELNKTLNVQLYGLFAKKKLPKEALLPTISRCYFYLAFENTISPHYITEKLWRNAFQAGAVPVVLGPPRRDYEAVAPSKSFIHVDDFKSVKALAEYLRGLTKDPKKYSSYFTWRQDYTVKLYTDWRERLCNICPTFGKFPTQKVYEDLSLEKMVT
ncbi:alpha-(1,3)-fucosyltransferase 7 [Pimephales promelas]|uniref:alpha-(1,3)-fucosyltransferase 7 n=1 Tax=Pimephales promelas TaxID=90988 RepID=UPI0019555017|nr:alpha-(1,3)-fucosyltransferase 7 [Pimephales promelas]KAG1928188.1 3-galactosyl-N-acetylglucosaminide 4-alpha-L-fucosyltransferase FUT3 [Pimephales promelas]